MMRQQKRISISALMFISMISICSASFAAEIPAETYTYDAQGNVLTATTRLGLTTTNTPDVFGRVVKQEAPVPATGVSRPTVTAAYNALDSLISIKDPRNLTTSYQVNGLNQVQQLTSPDTGTSSATFDAAGHVKTSKDSRGVTATYTYDALDRITAIAYPNWTSNTYTYGTSGTSAGRLTRFTDESGNTAYTYDGFGRLLTKIQTVNTRSVAIKYIYGTSGSATGKLLSMTYPSGVRLNVTYDLSGHVAALAINPTQSSGSGTKTAISLPIFSGATYAPTGLPSGWNWGGGVFKYARTYDLDGRVLSYTLGGYRRSLSYDNDGRVIGISSEGTGVPPPQSFGYDGLGRLVRFDSGTSAYTFSYDANGNRTGATTGASSQTVTVAAGSNKLTSISGALAKNYQFDAAGNMTSDGAATFTYSPRGRPSGVSKGGTAYTQLFNALGERVFKSSANTIYLYDGAGQLVGEYDASTGAAMSETIYFGGQPIAVVRQSVGGNGVVTTSLFYVHTDHLGTPRMITAAVGNAIRWRWDDADPFGQLPPIDTFGSIGQFVFNQRMAGQYYDRETNLFYNGFRDYDPQTGRYAQSDPIGLHAGINTYGYVGGNPLSYNDPTGLIAGVANPVVIGGVVITVACASSPGCRKVISDAAAATGRAVKAAGEVCEEIADEVRNWMAQEGTNSGPKVPPKLDPNTNPPQSPNIPNDWESRPGRNGGEVYYPPGSDPANGENIRVMPPGSTPVPGLEDGYWVWTNGHKQPIDPSTGNPGSRGQTHVPLPPDGMPPTRRP
jgi:RHS repeat-associated protein